jgi:Putative MetA-pathway of phenol degradation
MLRQIITSAIRKKRHFVLLVFCAQIVALKTTAQTEMDAIMMNKNQFCTGLMYTHSAWKNYWEGTLHRKNENIGTVTNQSIMVMANYGITNDLNVMVGLPYIWTKASAGTLKGLGGLQDASLTVKWKALKKNFGTDKFSVIVLSSISTPSNNYVIDYQPLAVGLGSTNLTGRLMLDYLRNRISVTASAAYVLRSKVKIDRTSYYDTQLHLSNEVDMPDAANYQLRAGYRGKYLIAEALLSSWQTLGGFDISRNNAPFPSNKMNVTSVGLHLKYTIPQLTNLSVLAGVNQVVAGRNMGESTAINGGIFYAFYFNKKSKPVFVNQ